MTPAPPSVVDDHRLREADFSDTGPGWWSAEAKFAIAIILIGLTAGLGGMFLSLLLRVIQHAAYGYSLDAVVSPESFLQGVTSSSPLRRIVALMLCGVLAGVGWWAVFRFGQKLVSVKAAVGTNEPGPPMPFLSTIAHALLQIATVALGSPLGREVAPREISALIAERLSSRLGLSGDEARIAIACGAGGGLAAVYNVPLAGAVFVLEVLLQTVAPRAVAAAIAASTIASTVAWIALGDVSQYTVPPLAIDWQLVAMSIVMGPVFGLAAYGFSTIAHAATSRASHGWTMIPWSLAVFLVIGVIAMRFPQLPGNGNGPSQLGFDGDLNGSLAAQLMILKVVAIAAALRAGAAGGILTPSLTLGALLATAVHVWIPIFPSVSNASFAIVGAAAFLASSMNMPLTASLLVVEFTRVSHDFYVPIFLAVAGSTAALRACSSLSANAAWPYRLPSLRMLWRRT